MSPLYFCTISFFPREAQDVHLLFTIFAQKSLTEESISAEGPFAEWENVYRITTHANWRIAMSVRNTAWSHYTVFVGLCFILFLRKATQSWKLLTVQIEITGEECISDVQKGGRI